jgi:inosine/xanthosine triphosphatase
MVHGGFFIVGVASLNRAKRAAVRQVMRRFSLPYKMLATAVPSGVGAQPQDDNETIRGALNRVRGLLESQSSVDLAVAFEGGIHRTESGVYATEWCAIGDRAGRATVGGGARILLPAQVSKQLDEGRELGTAFDELVGNTGTGAGEGAFGILTAGLVDRTDVDAQAFVLAMTRYLRPDLFGSSNLPHPVAEALTAAIRKRSDTKGRASLPLPEQLELLLLH